ncbi:hypothetical protein CK203_078109 [Vitis vinifera]|uniref:Uncharacterized protein n=1 Tax=Vitis vinifera TaxID=29760 RepID=A0A438ETQ4_VITVI|nr:hypothetical protein CK203_078109 [Vitis vinifera]
MKAEILELHQAVRHAGDVRTGSRRHKQEHGGNHIPIELAKETGPSHSQSPQHPKTISKFEEYRDSNKTKATKLPKKHPRCVADGNERLRFHCTTFVCSIGLNGSSNLCNSIPSCNICSIIKNGFKVAGGVPGKRILTTATSGKARDSARMSSPNGNVKRAMLVCRVTSHVDFSRSNGLSAVGNYYQQEMGGATCIQLGYIERCVEHPVLMHMMYWVFSFCYSYGYGWSTATTTFRHARQSSDEEVVMIYGGVRTRGGRVLTRGGGVRTKDGGVQTRGLEIHEVDRLFISPNVVDTKRQSLDAEVKMRDGGVRTRCGGVWTRGGRDIYLEMLYVTQMQYFLHHLLNNKKRLRFKIKIKDVDMEKVEAKDEDEDEEMEQH